MGLNILSAVGVIATYIGFSQAMSRKSKETISNREYESIFETKEEQTSDNIGRIISCLLYPGGYILILFSTRSYLHNLIMIVFLNFILCPIVWGVVNGIRSGKLLNFLLGKMGL